MFVCYIPGERASLCYAAGLLSPLAQKIPGCVVKTKPRKTQQSTRGVCLQGFSFVCRYYCTLLEVLLYVRARVCVGFLSKPC